MSRRFRPAGWFILFLLAGVLVAAAQNLGVPISRVDIKFIGPAEVSEDFVRSHLKLRAGGAYLPGATQDDIHALYATDQFYYVGVDLAQADDGGAIITYKVQARPRITDIRFEGNDKMRTTKLKKKLASKVGDPLDEQKLFTAVQDMKKLYEKSGYPDTLIKYVLNIDPTTGHGIVTFHIEETPKIKIEQVNFFGAAAFTQDELRKAIKTRAHWMWSWITGSGYLKQDEFDGDADRLTSFYHSHGYLDFDIKDVKRESPSTNLMIIKYDVFEGKQYRVGSVRFTGKTLFPEAEIISGLKTVQRQQNSKVRFGANGLPMDVGDVFTPGGLDTNITAVKDFYGSRGYIDIAQGRALRVKTTPNIEQGTMDLEFLIDESQRTYVQKIEIHGNLKTKDRVIRRELAIAPGDLFDMVRVRVSQRRLEGLQFFSKVDLTPEQTDPPIPGRQNLIISVEEQSTGNVTVGAGFSSVDSLAGYVMLTQGNFDLFHPPYFTGAGQKLRILAQVGLKRQDYELDITEPWFLGRKLSLTTSLYRRQNNYDSPNNIYERVNSGGRLSLTRALGSDFLMGSVSYTAEAVGISLNSGWHGYRTVVLPGQPAPQQQPPNVPRAIMDQVGNHFFQRFGASLAYDTRNSTQLPNHGQRTELFSELSVGSPDFYKLEASTAWYFPGFLKGHVLELVARTGTAQSFQGGDVPFYDRYYLGGLYSLRGFKYRNVAPRDSTVAVREPIGGDTFWMGSAEYSVPIVEKDSGVSVRFALFYDIGAVAAGSYSYNFDYLDNWGVGLRVNIPALHMPMRLDYGIPITHDQYNGSGGHFQFGVGFTRPY